MQTTRAALRLRAPVQFRDRWQGTVAAFEVDADWSLLNVVVASGLLRRAEVRLPFSIATAWDDDHLALDCTSYQAFRREVPPVAVPSRPFSPRTPLSAAGAKLAGFLVEREARRVSHLLLRLGLFGSDRRQVAVRDVALEAGAIRLAVQAEALPLYRADRELEEALWQALVQYPLLTGDDRRGLNVEVADAVAYLSGNVRTPQVRKRARDVAASVPGLVRVEDRVIDDRRLEIDVARALDTAGLYRHGRIYVQADVGAVVLGGFLATDSRIPEVVRVTESVPGVRKVETRIEVRALRPPQSPGPDSPPAPPAAPVAEGPTQR